MLLVINFVKKVTQNEDEDEVTRNKTNSWILIKKWKICFVNQKHKVKSEKQTNKL